MFLNIANTTCAILAPEPAVRLCGSESTTETFVDLSNESNINWISISKEPKDSSLIFNQWNIYREKICEDLYNAMNGQHNRNRRIVLFERIMAKYQDRKRPVISSNRIIVPKIDRNSEVRGQRFAIISIIGDASYELSKSSIMERLANMYIEHMCATLEIDEIPQILSASEDKIITAYFENDNIDNHDDKFVKYIENEILDMSSLPNEPIVSIWAVSEDAESLEEKAKKISEMPEMKHADVAVVSMYEWLYIESWKKFKVRRTSRDPRAEQFFKIMREHQAN